MDEFEQYLKESLDHLPACTVTEAMKYSLLAPGKRVRPNLLFKTLEAYGIDPKKGYELAAAIEMIHTYSLIHDDLPAMDNDDFRRGRPSCHKAFDEASAILAGDALLTEAFYQAALSKLSGESLAKAVRFLSKQAGAAGMVYGQQLDMDASSIRSIPLFEIEAYKTGCLLTLPFMMASLLAEKESDIPVWEQIGEDLGIEFQIQDDILDVTKTSAELGKSNSDQDNNKLTFVSAYGLEEAKRSGKKRSANQSVFRESGSESRTAA